EVVGMMNQKPELAFEGLIRSRDAARLLGMSEWLLRKLAHEGELPYIQGTITSPLLFDPVDLRKWIEREKARGNGR
ncbi:MAG TPA: helix-turn-helix domain-containing protein, partial [Candidatus Acidoferrum sp.]